jgi:outer membrane protein assembly factor BamB
VNLRRCAIALVGLASACGGGSAPAGPGSGVLQHHNRATRDGVYVDAALTKAAVATMHLDPTFTSPMLDGVAFAQVLSLDGVGGKPDLVFAATKANHVYALNAATGAAVWDLVVAPLGVRPSTVCTAGPVGISGTPIIDGGRRIIYLDAMTETAADGGTTLKHMVYALDADTGAVRPGWPVDVDAKARAGTLAFNSSVQNQRGALALLNGTLYVPYGGFGGDCGDYHGWVVGISTDDPTRVSAWATRSTRSGIWAPSGVVSDGKSLFVTTGNATVGPTWLDGEAVIKLPPSLAASDNPTDYYTPPNWSFLDEMDLDLGSTAPLLVDVPGATPSSLVLALGKDRQGYVLDRNNLGGISAPLTGALVSGEAIFGATATFTTPMGTFVAFRGFGANVPIVAQGHVTVFTITATTPPTLKGVWCGGPNSFSSPTVSMIDAQGTNALIWVVGLDDKLHAYDAETGAEIFAGGTDLDLIPGVQKYQAAIVAHGRVFVVGARVYAFKTNAAADASAD